MVSRIRLRLDDCKPMMWTTVQYININSLPMVVDIAPDDRLLGTYTGLYYISGTLAAILGPILNGWIIDATGSNYNTIFWMAPAFMLVAIVCMWFVTRGEARPSD